MSTVAKMKSRSEAGIYPAGSNVLIRADELEEEVTDSGIILPKDVKAKFDAAGASGTLVAVGPDAWNHVVERVYHVHDVGKELIEERFRGYSEPFASVGERVAFTRYSGQRGLVGEDGNTYILMNDEDITARLSDNVEFTELETRKPLGEQGHD